MKKNLLFVFVALILQQYVFAQGFDPTWANRFQTVLDSVILANNVKGGSAAVLFPGQGLWTGVSGIASPGVPLTPDRRFCIASNTKLFIAVTLAKLQEQGILSLDDSLYMWLPTFQYVDSTVTIRQLLSHQSGIFDCINDGSVLWNAIWADTSHFWTPQEILATIGPPNFEPGHGWRYSNTNYLLVSMVIEAATGKTWVQKLHDFIFDPLDMDSTFVAVFEPQNGPIAPMCNYGQWHYHLETSLYSVEGPFGGIFSTAQEMVQWYHALFNGEIISDSSLQEILKIESSSLFGLGITAHYDATLTYPGFNHGGNIGNGYVSQIAYDVKTQSVLCLLTNGGLDFSYLPLLLNPLTDVLLNEYPKKQNDAGITRIISPWDNICITTASPTVILKNFGSDPLTSVMIHCMVDNSSPSFFPWTGILSTDSTVTVILNNITPSEGYHLLTCYTSGPNGGAEGYIFNDTTVSNFIVNGSVVITAPWSEDFEDTEFPPAGWIEDPMVSIQCGRTKLVSCSGLSSAVKCNYWDDHIGSKYNLDIPMLDISNISNPVLKFMYAYAPLAGWDVYDSLKILVSQDCGATWQTLFYDGGYSLATAPAASNAFFPKSNEWSQKIISLAEYTGNILIRFQEICGYANNLFIDNVEVGYPTGFDNQSITNNQFQIKNYPNPVNDITTFSFVLQEPGLVRLQIYDCFGNLVDEPVNCFQQKGERKCEWNSANQSAGIYYYRISTSSIMATGKMIVTK